MTAQILPLRPEYAPNPAWDEWLTELHPWWDQEQCATGCGTHVSKPESVYATADSGDVDGGPPLVQVAAWMGEDGAQGVQVFIGRPDGEAWAVLTADQWRQIVAYGAKALGFIDSDPAMAPLPADQQSA